MDLVITAKTQYEDDVLTAQGDLLGADASCAPAECYHPFGFIGRPKDPDLTPDGKVLNGARLLFWYEGSTMHSMVLDDPRRAAKLPKLDKGGAMMYADVDGAYVKYAADGSLEIRVPSGVKAIVQTGSGAKVEVSDSEVKAGNDAAVPLVVAAWASGVAAALSALATSLTSAAAFGTLNTAGGTLTSALGSLPAPATTILKGT
jgi:hypothetical protein